MTELVISDFTVTRQCPYHSGNNVVEISQGGIDYTGADALCQKYAGEFETFQGMTPAVEAAIEIAEAWKKDTKDPIYISHGCSHGMGLSFDEEEATEEVYASLRQFAKEFDEKLPRCAQCGELLGKDRYGSHDVGEYDCCSEYCAEQRWFTPDEGECANCGDTFFDEGEEYHIEGFCSAHCLNRHRGDDCEGGCEFCDDDEED